MEMTDERRSQKREAAKYCYHAEIRLIGVPVYEVKIKDLSSNGASILVKKDSLLLNHLGIGKTISVKYYLGDRSKAFGPFKASIKHLTQFEEGRFKGHFSAGLSISVRDEKMSGLPE
jgi:hypothetical protein